MKTFLNPEDFFKKLTLKEDMLACEFGCGSGIFAISLAKRLKKGKVYGLDIQEEKLSVLKSRAILENLLNIETIVCDLEKPKGSTLQNDFLDLVLIPNVLFQAEEKGAIIEEAKRILKPGGQLLILDWTKEAPFGPEEGRITVTQVKKIAEKLNLKLKKEFSAGAYHYGLVFTKP